MTPHQKAIEDYWLSLIEGGIATIFASLIDKATSRAKRARREARSLRTSRDRYIAAVCELRARIRLADGDDASTKDPATP